MKAFLTGSGLASRFACTTIRSKNTTNEPSRFSVEDGRSREINVSNVSTVAFSASDVGVSTVTTWCYCFLFVAEAPKKEELRTDSRSRLCG